MTLMDSSTYGIRIVPADLRETTCPRLFLWVAQRYFFFLIIASFLLAGFSGTCAALCRFVASRDWAALAS